MTGHLLALPWYGGKYIHLDFLFKFMPHDIQHFVDVFGGGGSVVINAPDYPVKTYNDINGDVVNFFRMLREQPDALLERIYFTPFARDELAAATAEQPEDLSDVERARRFYVRVRQGRNAAEGVDGFGARQWRRSAFHHRAVAKVFAGHADELLEVVDRIKVIQIENDPAKKIINGLDSPGAFFYCDPPYVSTTRSGGQAYKFEMSEEEHIEFAMALQFIKGRAMVSGYRCKLYDDLFSGWNRFDSKPMIAPTTRNSAPSARVESVWLNYDPPRAAITTQEALEL